MDLVLLRFFGKLLTFVRWLKPTLVLYYVALGGYKSLMSNLVYLFLLLLNTMKRNHVTQVMHITILLCSNTMHVSLCYSITFPVIFTLLVL